MCPSSLKEAIILYILPASKTFMDEKELQKKIMKGAVLCQVAFEILGNPKEYVENTIRSYVNNIRNDSGIMILSEEYGEAEAVEGDLWSTYVDCEMLFENLEKINWLCINFMPASLEIIAPEELRFSDKDLTMWFNDLLAKLHEISASVRETTTKDQLAVKTMNALIQNIIILATEHYHKTKEISEKTGMPEAQLQPFFDALIKQGKLEKKGEEYYHKSHVQKGEKKSGAKKRD
jgi:hypothetical protein